MREIDGNILYRLFLSGSKHVHEAKLELDRINVFPVPDGDTGSNMSFTLGAAVAGAQSHSSASIVAGSMSDAALAGARGNSGVILAQFLSGFNEGIGSKAVLSLDAFVSSVETACARAYEALAVPAEGTILSAIRAWTEGLIDARIKSATLIELLDAAHPRLAAAVRDTPQSLAVLRDAGVVDAGASGFEALVQGFRAYAAGSISDEELSRGIVAAAPVHIEPEDEVPGSYPALRYCCEFYMKPHEGEILDAAALRALLERCGDSVIVAGGGARARVHVHADNPSSLAALLARAGTLIEQKAEDMALQYLDAHERLADVAIVTDSACDLPDDLIVRYRIHQVPLLLRFGEEEYLDKLTMTPELFYDRAESRAAFPKSSQPTAQAFSRVYGALLSRYRSVIAIHISRSMSGTYEASAREAARLSQETGARIDVYDSKHLSGSLGLIVLKAAEMAAAGHDHDAILNALPELSRRAENLVSVRTLRYMVKGGRVSPLRGLAAQLLNLKPIVSVDKEGRSLLYGKSFSVKANKDKIVAMARDFSARGQCSEWAIVHARAGREAHELALRLEAALGKPPRYVCEISAIVGMNSGRGAISFVCL
jgi:DegV family protein with EDD domain